jgi:hypothetical protein
MGFFNNFINAVTNQPTMEEKLKEAEERNEYSKKCYNRRIKEDDIEKYGSSSFLTCDEEHAAEWTTQPSQYDAEQEAMSSYGHDED